jgi:hypothetical protein
MSTPLVWKAIELCSKIFNPILYPHIVTPSSTTEQISIETRCCKRFHVSTCVLTTILVFELPFLARYIFESSFECKHWTPFYIELTALTPLHLVLTLINQTAGQQLWTSVNTALKVERKIIGKTMAPLGYASQTCDWKLISQGNSYLIKFVFVAFFNMHQLSQFYL